MNVSELIPNNVLCRQEANEFKPFMSVLIQFQLFYFSCLIQGCYSNGTDSSIIAYFTTIIKLLVFE